MQKAILKKMQKARDCSMEQVFVPDSDDEEAAVRPGSDNEAAIRPGSDNEAAIRPGSDNQAATKPETKTVNLFQSFAYVPPPVEKTEPTKIVTTKTASTIEPPQSTNTDLLDIRELSVEQRAAYYKFIEGKNLFITGSGGTGKTRLIKHLLNHTQSVSKPTAVCAMTGCAAILLNCGARTLHSWSGIKLAKGDSSKIIANVLRNKKAVSTWRKTKVLILDEVSMLSRKIFELVEAIARQTRGSVAPFGGMQVIFTGDFFQLPPVGTDGEPETEQFCFESPIWKTVFPPDNNLELKTMFRQRDPIYINILQQVRRGQLDEKGCQILLSHVNRPLDEEKLNGCVPTKLFALRMKTDMINTQMFSKINEKEYVFEIIQKKDCRTIIESNKPLDIQSLQKSSKLTDTEIEYEMTALTNNMSSPKLLRLKKGAVVMCTVNLDMESEICNGSQGVVIDIIESHNNEYGIPCPVVKFTNGIIKKIAPHFWQSEDYPTLAVGQIPLCLAWALTIHKIQGATLKMAEMDLGYSVFEYGQTYVALSRIQSLDGLYLSSFHPQKIKANPKVIEFYKQFDKK